MPVWICGLCSATNAPAAHECRCCGIDRAREPASDLTKETNDG